MSAPFWSPGRTATGSYRARSAGKLKFAYRPQAAERQCPLHPARVRKANFAFPPRPRHKLCFAACPLWRRWPLRRNACIGRKPSARLKRPIDRAARNRRLNARQGSAAAARWPQASRAPSALGPSRRSLPTEPAHFHTPRRSALVSHRARPAHPPPSPPRRTR